jgi:tRNA-dihydrouridine synthase A
MARHYLGLSHGMKGARQWRRMLSDANLLADNRADLIAEAGAALNLR